MKRTIVLFVAAACLILSAYSSQDTPRPRAEEGSVLVIDLSQYAPGKTYALFTEIGKIKELSLLNTYSYCKYTVQYRMISPPAPFDSAAFREGAAIAAKDKDIFATLESLENKYANLANEGDPLEEKSALLSKDIQAAYSKAHDLFDALERADQTEAKQALLDKAKAINENQSRNWPIGISLGDGDYARFVVERWPLEGTKVAYAKWEFIVDTAKQKGYWLTSFGFAFMTPLITKEYDYYSVKRPEGDGFSIASDERKTGRDFSAVPSIFFTYLPASYRYKTVNFGVSAGLGLKDNIAVFLAGTMNIYSNISVHLGVGIHSIDRLLPKYRGPNIVLPESLDSSQLVRSELGAGVFLSISFRFDSNPFGGSERKPPAI